MIRRITSGLRVVAPPGWWTVLFLLVFAGTEGPILYFERQAGQPIVWPFRPGRWCLIAGAVLLGLYRVTAFHPYFSRDYLRWLKSTPWTVAKPLPVGPVELVPRDALAVGGLMLLGLVQPQTGPVELLNVFLFAHTAWIAGTFWTTGVPGFGYGAALALGFVPQFWDDAWLDLGILTAVYLLVHEGLWRSLSRFPWPTEGHADAQELLRRQEERYGPACGWPYDRLLRDVKTATEMGRADALLCSLLVGWWVFALGEWMPRWFRPQFVLIALFNFALMRRGMRYFVGYAPPMGLAGRIGTFRWIVPGYDRAFLAMVLAVLALPVAMLGGAALGVPPQRCLPAVAALVTLITLTTPPSLRNWRLTGRHRLVPAIPKGSRDYVQIG